MKFTNGYWMLRKEYESKYAVEYYSHEIDDDKLKLFVSTYHLEDRHFTIGTGTLNVTLSSPMANVIKVTLDNRLGAQKTGPDYQLEQLPDYSPEIVDSEHNISVISGGLTAEVCKDKNSWKINFIDTATGKTVTDTGYRNMGAMINKEDEKVYVTDMLSIGIGGYVYGFGEKFTPFVKNGSVVDMWMEDGGTVSEIAYKNMPFYITNKGYGVFVDSPIDTSFEVASENVERVRFSHEGQSLTYYVIYGPDPKAVISRYTALTGRPALPPAWSFGLWLSSSFMTDYDEKTASSFIDGMKERDIPLSVFHYDCFWMKEFQWTDYTWDPDVFPDPQGMIDRFHEKGLKVSVWTNPYIGQKSPLFKEALEKGYFAHKTNGDVWQTDQWQAGMAIVDFTNPDACKWLSGKLEELLNMGVDAVKTDFGERIPVRDIVYHDGSDPLKMHNYFTYLYNKCIFETVERVKGKGNAVLFARSATAGGQKFPAHWGGDCTARYESMAETLRGGLSLSICGFGFWSHDISGFESTATPDLYKRWCQFGLLSTHSRLHGASSYRVPWVFDDESTDVLRFFTKLKCRLMPYIYGHSAISHEIGVPVLRPMVVDFPDDLTVPMLDRQYMFGDDLLVAPIFNDQSMAEYYLPEGKWTNLITKEKIDGGKWIREKHDYFSLPLMVKPGSVIPFGSCDSKPDYDYAKDVTLELYEIADGSEITTVIRDIKGDPALTFVTKRTGDTITVTADSKSANFYIKLSNKDDRLQSQDGIATLKI